MKFTTAYYLMLFYCTVMLNPVIPVVKDVISHSFAEAYHIMVIHANYGANHVEKEIADSEKDNSKNQNSAKSEEQISVHLINEDLKDNLLITSFKFLKPVLIQARLCSVYLSKQIRPPRLS